MSASSRPIKKIKTEFGAVSTLRDDTDAESTFDCVKRKNIRRKLPTTNLVDLNDDCLYIIFDMVRSESTSDFHSLSKTCKRLNDIGSDIFQRKIKVCNLQHIVDAKTVMDVLKTFGSVISKLRINLITMPSSAAILIMESIIRFCTGLKSLTIDGCIVPANKKKEISKFAMLFNNLEELHLNSICFEDGALIENVFINCESLISLNVDSCYNFKRTIFQSRFPNLEHFSCRNNFEKCVNVNDFILRHPNLKSFRIDSVEGVDYLDALAAGCKTLTDLDIRLDTKINIVYPYTYPLSRRRSHSISADSMKCLTKLQHLKEFTVECCGYEAATKLIEVLPHLSPTLECLHIKTFSGRLALMPAVIQLKSLRIFRLHEHIGSIDISRIGELTQLIELSLIDVEVKKVALVEMVNDLVNLKKLTFYVNDFEITNKLYGQLLDVLKRRNPENQHLDMYCLTAAEFMQKSQTMLKIKWCTRERLPPEHHWVE